jgi:glycosyltransferase involved in cell wall biosynthesis
MKILVLANAMNTLSGGDKRFVEIFRRIHNKGHPVSIMLPQIGYTICKAEKLGVSYQVLPFPSLNNLGPVLSNFLRSLLACILVVKDFGKYDVVYSSSDFLNDTIPGFVLKMINKRVKWVSVTHYLIPPPSERDGSFFANLVSFISQRITVGLMRRFVNQVITSSLFLKKQLVSLGVSKDKIRVGSNGVDIKLIDNMPSNQSRYYDACFAARLHPSKGVYDVLDAWELVCKSKPDSKLVMIGYGKAAVINEIRDRIARKQLSNNIELAGFKKSFIVYE